MIDLIKSEIRSFKRFLKNKLNQKLIFVLSLFILIAALTFKILAFQIEQALIDRTFVRQQAMAQAGSKSINSLLEIMSHAIVELADEVNLEGDIQQSLEDFIAQWQKTPIKSIAFIDENGIRQAISTTSTESIKPTVDVSEVKSFQWAKQAKKGEVHIGEAIVPPGIVRTIYVIPVVTPVVRDGQFKGALAIPIYISYLAEEYLNPLRVTDLTRVYLVNSNGVLIYTPTEGLIGLNYFDVLKQRDFPEKEEAEKELRLALESGKRGKLDIKLPNEQAEGAITRFLVSYSPVKENDNRNFLVIATPIDHIIDLYKPFLTSLGLGIILMTFCVFILIALIVLTWKTIQRDAFEDGFKAGKKYLKRKK